MAVPVTGGCNAVGMSTQTPTRDGEVLLTPADAARLAQVSRDRIYREIERGKLRALLVRAESRDLMLACLRGAGVGPSER
jgi:hypothetical protein